MHIWFRYLEEHHPDGMCTRQCAAEYTQNCLEDEVARIGGGLDSEDLKRATVLRMQSEALTNLADRLGAMADEIFERLGKADRVGVR